MAAAKAGTKDLTQGNIAKQLLLFMLPILVGQIFQNLYNSVDAIVVGQFVGTTALAAVTSSADIGQLLIGFFTGFSTGSGVLISRHFGGKDYEGLSDGVHTSVMLALLIGIFMAVTGIVLAPFLLHVVECPPDVYDEALAYLRVYLIGIFFTSIYNVGAAILRAVGDSKRPFYYLVISSVWNIILDVAFTVGLHLGVVGVALATIMAQLVSVVLVFGQLMRSHDVYRLELKKLRLQPKILKEVFMLGLPAGIQSALISTSNLFVQRYVNAFGSAAMAGIGAGKKIDKFVGMMAQCMGLALSTFVSQNVGAKKTERAFRGVHVSLFVCTIYWIIAGCIVYIFAPFFVGFFVSDSAEALQHGVTLIRVMMPLYMFQISNNIYANAVRGFGKSLVVMIISISGMIGFRQIFLALFTYWCPGEVWVVDAAFPVGWAFAAVGCIIYYYFVIRLPYQKQMKRAGITAS